VWNSREARSIGLVVVTGLIVSFVRQEIQHHRHGFASWESFFISWFIHTIAVSVFSVFAAAAIMGAHKFFMGDKYENDIERLVFYVVMTVLLGAFAIAIVANAPVYDEDTRLLLTTLVG